MVALAVVAAAPVFAYGRMAGNIRAERVTIARSGVVRVDSIPIRAHVSAKKLASLVALARRLRFAAMAPRTTCASSLPDFATRYVTHRGHTVRARGSCSKRFDTLYEALGRATGVP
jgi:hypothetical protein